MATWCGRAGELPSDKPSVHLLVDASVDHSAARWVAAGCEEEGVPLAWDEGTGDADTLARQASTRSRLEVGVGVDPLGGAVALAKIPQRAYVVEGGSDPATLRHLGQCAARLAKGEPVPRKAPPGAESPKEMPPPGGGAGTGDLAAFPGEEAQVRLLTEAVLRALAERPGGRDGSA